MGSWCNGQLVVWAFILILLHSSLWFIWNNCICQLPTSYISTASYINKRPITPWTQWKHTNTDIVIFHTFHMNTVFLRHVVSVMGRSPAGLQYFNCNGMVLLWRYWYLYDTAAVSLFQLTKHAAGSQQTLGIGVQVGAGPGRTQHWHWLAAWSVHWTLSILRSSSATLFKEMKKLQQTLWGRWR